MFLGDRKDILTIKKPVPVISGGHIPEQIEKEDSRETSSSISNLKQNKVNDFLHKMLLYHLLCVVCFSEIFAAGHHSGTIKRSN